METPPDAAVAVAAPANAAPADAAPTDAAPADAAPADAPPAPRRSKRKLPGRYLRFQDEDLSQRAVRARHEGGLCLCDEAKVMLEVADQTLINALASPRRRAAKIVQKGARCRLRWKTVWKPASKALLERPPLRELRRLLMPRSKEFYAVIVQGQRRRSVLRKAEHLYYITEEVKVESARRIPPPPKAEDKSDNAGADDGDAATSDEDEDAGEERDCEFAVGPLLQNSTFELSGVLSFTMPLTLEPGTYCLELGSPVLNVCCTTPPFSVIEAFGEIDNTKVGPWCLCGCVRAGDDDVRELRNVDWVSCTTCHSWHHFHCYERGETNAATSSPSVFNEVELRLLGHEADTPLPSGDESFTCWWCFDFAMHLDELEDELRHGPLSARLYKLAPRPPASKQERLMWLLGRMEVERIERVKGMIEKSSGGYFRKKQDKHGNAIVKRAYRTPNHAVCFLEKLVQLLHRGGPEALVAFAHGRRQSDAVRDRPPPPPPACLDLGAGAGALTNVLPPNSVAIEIEEPRYLDGLADVPDCSWVNADALNSDIYHGFWNRYDLVVSNPDFEVALIFLCIAHHALRLDNPDARMIFLLPSDFFEASAMRSRVFKLLPLSVELEFKLGHLDFLQHTSDVSSTKRSVDSFFVFKHDPSRSSKFAHTLVNARLAGML